MADTLDSILNAFPWDDHGIYTSFDRQGRATILSEVDDRYVRITAKQVEGLSRSNLINGVVVELLTATKGQLDRTSFHFGHHGMPAELQGIDERNGVTTWYWKQAYGTGRYEGDPIDATELVEAVAGFMATVGMVPIERPRELNQDNSVIVTLECDTTFEAVLHFPDGCNVELLLTDGREVKFSFSQWGRSERGWEQLEGWVTDEHYIEKLRPIEVELADIVEVRT